MTANEDLDFTSKNLGATEDFLARAKKPGDRYEELAHRLTEDTAKEIETLEIGYVCDNYGIDDKKLIKKLNE